jgi:hypothetical protein
MAMDREETVGIAGAQPTLPCEYAQKNVHFSCNLCKIMLFCTLEHGTHAQKEARRLKGTNHGW